MEISINIGACDADVDKVEQGVRFILPYVIPLTQFDSECAVFNIMERTCGEFGVYYFYINKATDKVRIEYWKYGRSRDSYLFDNIRLGLEYVRKNLYNDD